MRQQRFCFRFFLWKKSKTKPVLSQALAPPTCSIVSLSENHTRLTKWNWGCKCKLGENHRGRGGSTLSTPNQISNLVSEKCSSHFYIVVGQGSLWVIHQRKSLQMKATTVRCLHAPNHKLYSSRAGNKQMTSIEMPPDQCPQTGDGLMATLQSQREELTG